MANANSAKDTKQDKVIDNKEIVNAVKLVVDAINNLRTIVQKYKEGSRVTIWFGPSNERGNHIGVSVFQVPTVEEADRGVDDKNGSALMISMGSESDKNCDGNGFCLGHKS